MKKASLFILVSAILFGMTACIKAGIEKEPVVVEEGLTTSSGLNLTKNQANTTTPAPTLIADAEKDTADITDEAIAADSKDTEADSTSGDKQSDKEIIDADEDTDNDTYEAVITLEGVQEKVSYKKFNSDLGFSISYDHERFSVSKISDGVLQIIAPNPDPGIYPYVYMNICRYNNKDIDSVIRMKADLEDKNMDPYGKFAETEKFYWKQIQEENNENLHYIQIPDSDFKTDSIQAEDIGGYTAYSYTLRLGNAWNSAIRKYYFITLDSYLYKIEMQYFVEAEEGYGARLSAMLATLSFY